MCAWWVEPKNNSFACKIYSPWCAHDESRKRNNRLYLKDTLRDVLSVGRFKKLSVAAFNNQVNDGRSSELCSAMFLCLFGRLRESHSEIANWGFRDEPMSLVLEQNHWLSNTSSHLFWLCKMLLCLISGRIWISILRHENRSSFSPTHLSLSLIGGLGTTAISPASWAWLPAWGSEPTIARPIMAGDEFYFEDQGGIAPTGEISPNLYGILVFLLNQLLQRSLSNDVRRRVEGRCGGKR